MTSVNVEFKGRKVNFKAEPNKTLAHYFDDACKKLKVDPLEYGLRMPRAKQGLDLSLTVRLAGLHPGITLELFPQQRRDGLQASIAFQVEGMELATAAGKGKEGDLCHVACGESLRGALRAGEVHLGVPLLRREAPGGGWLQPTVTVMSRQVTGYPSLESTTLASLGVAPGAPVRLSVSFRPLDAGQEVPPWAMKQGYPRASLASAAERASAPDATAAAPLAATAAAALEDQGLVAQAVSGVEAVCGAGGAPADVVPVPSAQEAVDHPMEGQVAAASGQGVGGARAPRAPRVYTQDFLQQSLEEVTGGAVAEESDEFFELTVQDYQRLVASAKQHQRQDAVMKTREMREKEESRLAKEIGEVTIRVRFPNGVFLETEFSASDQLEALRQFVADSLVEPTREFYLYTVPPKHVLQDMSLTFLKAQLVPAAYVHFSFVSAAKGEHRKPVFVLGRSPRDRLHYMVGNGPVGT
eukprot:jgi/Mesvir1/28896/Mv17986-RA.2